MMTATERMSALLDDIKSEQCNPVTLPSGDLSLGQADAALAAHFSDYSIELSVSRSIYNKSSAPTWTVWIHDESGKAKQYRSSLLKTCIMKAVEDKKDGETPPATAFTAALHAIEAVRTPAF